MSPIRVGFLGLSKSGWASYAHFPYLQASDKYQIVAICNSTVASSQEAIKLYSLPKNLAKDPNIDLVVCSVRVDRHYPTIAPSLKAGKDVYVEWPLGVSLSEAQELLKLKNEGGVKNAVVGLQARQSPILKTLKNIIEIGNIGEVLSSTWVGQAGSGGPTVMEAYEYLGRRSVGGNMMSIHFGHAIDYIQFVLGYNFLRPPKSLIANRRPFQKLLNSEGELVEEKHPKDAEDTIFLHGNLSTVVPISFSLRGGKPFPSTPGLVWTIYGEKGEIRLTAGGPFLNIEYGDVEIKLWDSEKDVVETVNVEDDEFDSPNALGEGKGYGLPSRNVGRVYEELAAERINCSFEDAVERHELIEGLYLENGVAV